MALTFVALVLIEFFKAYHFRSDLHSMLRRTFANRWLNLAVLWELLLLGLIIYVPFLQGVFGTAGVRPSDWLLIACPSVTLWVVLESAKWVLRRGWLGEVDVACRLDAGRARGHSHSYSRTVQGTRARAVRHGQADSRCLA